MDGESSEEDLRGILKTRKFNFCIPDNVEAHPRRFQSVDQAIAEFGYLEIKLNSIRHILSDIDIQTWTTITDNSDISAKFKSTILNYFQKCIDKFTEEYQARTGQAPTQEVLSEYSSEPEMLTRAWIKFHEILAKYELVEKLCSTFTIDLEKVSETGQDSFRALFLCEAPGGFVSAFNNHIGGQAFRWVATSLNPYHEACGKHNSTILDDRLIADTYTNWYFGPDNTGHIGHERYLSGLRDFIRDRWPDLAHLSDDRIQMHLITADGGLDCADQPHLQEQLSFNLIVREVHVALHLLAVGGTFVVKFFNSFKRGTIYLLHVLYETFEHVSSFKPISSKGGNSEVYLICVGFRRNDSSAAAIERFEQKLARYRSLNSFEFPVDWHEIPTEFIYLTYEHCHFFTKKQIAIIRHNVFLYECSIYEIKMKSKSRLKSSVAKRFLTFYPIRLIGESRSLAAKHSREQQPSMLCSALPAETEEADLFYSQMRRCVRLRSLRHFVEQRRGSLKWRLLVGNSEFEPNFIRQLLSEAVTQLTWAQQNFAASFTIVRPDLTLADFAAQHLHLMFGRRFDCVQNSRICDQSVLQVRNVLQKQSLLGVVLSIFDETHMSRPINDDNVLKCVQSTLTRHLIDSDLMNYFKNDGRKWSICDRSTFSVCRQSKPLTYESVADAFRRVLQQDDEQFRIAIHDQLPTERPANEPYIFVFESDANLPEYSWFEQLLEQMHATLPVLTNQDIVVIRFDLVLSRLLTQLLYLFALFVFDKYSVVPLLLQPATSAQPDRTTKSVLSNLIVLQSSADDVEKRLPFAERVELLQRTLERIRMQRQITTLFEHDSLLELYPPPILLKGTQIASY
jgi:23S rRNA U2552 (ribose-2'-O)-methylase RlmE/FtsJ